MPMPSSSAYLSDANYPSEGHTALSSAQFTNSGGEGAEGTAADARYLIRNRVPVKQSRFARAMDGINRKLNGLS